METINFFKGIVFFIGAPYRVSQKVGYPLRLLHIFQLVLTLRRLKFTQLFAIHILIYVPFLVHLS